MPKTYTYYKYFSEKYNNLKEDQNPSGTRCSYYRKPRLTLGRCANQVTYKKESFTFNRLILTVGVREPSFSMNAVRLESYHRKLHRKPA